MSQNASIKNLETELTQLNTTLLSHSQGTLPSNTQPNPKSKEQCNIVTLQSVKTLEPMDKLEEKGCHYYADPVPTPVLVQSPRPALEPSMDALSAPT